MRKALIIACTMLFVSALGFAQTPSAAPLPSEALAAILGPTGDCAPTQNEVVLAAKRPQSGQYKALCFALALCADGATVTCYGWNSTTSCAAWDRNCAINERGHVTCDGITTWCPTTCPIDWCAQCNATGDCFACCRCEGLYGCVRLCSDPIPKEP